MKTITLVGIDEVDLNRKQWDWQITAVPPIRILKIWPDERLPLEVRPLRLGEKILVSNQIKRRVDYEHWRQWPPMRRFLRRVRLATVVQHCPHRMLNATGTVKLNSAPGMSAGGAGNGCAFSRVAMAAWSSDA